jgi:ParB family chromosome partitioning protein
MEEAIREIPLAQLSPDPENRRYGGFNETKLKELAESIKAKGVLEPILVRPSAAGRQPGDPELFDIAAGERRWRAAQIAELQTVPCVVRDLDDLAVLEIRAIENVQREDVHPLDEAESYARLIATGSYDVKTLAGKVGKSASYIYQSLKLRELVPEAVESLSGGSMTTGHAILIARLQPDDQRAVLEMMKKRSGLYYGEDHVMSVRDLETTIHRDYFRELSRAAFRKDDADLLPAAGPCTTCPKRTGAQPDLQTSAKEDACLDPRCYNAKLDALVERQKAKLEGAPYLLAAGAYEGKPTPKGLVERYNWEECKKKDRGAKQILIASGSDRGRLTWAKLRTQRTGGSYAPAGETPQEKEKRLREEGKEKEKRDVAVLTRRKTLDQVIAAAGKARTRNKKLALEVLRQAAAVLYRNLDLFGSDEDVFTVFWDEELDFKKATARIAEMSETELLDLFLKLAFIEDVKTYGARSDALGTAAKTLRLDIKAIEKEARAEIKEKARQTEAQGKEPTPGTCAVCGCTDDHACDDDGEPCHWVNEDHTLCSACEKNKKEPGPPGDYLDMIEGSQGDEA